MAKLNFDELKTSEPIIKAKKPKKPASTKLSSTDLIFNQGEVTFNRVNVRLRFNKNSHDMMVDESGRYCFYWTNRDEPDLLMEIAGESVIVMATTYWLWEFKIPRTDRESIVIEHPAEGTEYNEYQCLDANHLHRQISELENTRIRLEKEAEHLAKHDAIRKEIDDNIRLRLEKEDKEVNEIIKPDNVEVIESNELGDIISSLDSPTQSEPEVIQVEIEQSTIVVSSFYDDLNDLLGLGI